MGLKDELAQLAGGIGAGAKQRGSFKTSVEGMTALLDATTLLNRGLNSQIGFNESLIDTYVELATKSLIFEARNKDINKTFGITSRGAAKVSQEIHKLAAAHGFSGEQAIGYANSIKKLLPGFKEQATANKKTYESMQRIQHVLTTNLGLTEEATEKYTLYASKNGENADTTLAFAAALAKTLGDTDGTMGYMKMAIEGIAEASETTQLQFGKIPGNLEMATIKAKTLGFELDDLADMGKSLLDIESSIGQELEYQLLSGHRLTDVNGKSLTNAYREATLRGNMSDAASTLNTILEQEGDVLENNLFAREQMAKLMGMDEASLSRALQKKKLLSSQPNLNVLMNLDGTELQKAAEGMLKNGEMTQEAFNEITELNDTRTTDQIMRNQLVVATEGTGYLKEMLQGGQVDSVDKQRTALTGGELDTFKNSLLNLTEAEMKGLGATENLTDVTALVAERLKLAPIGKMASYESKATIIKKEDAVIPAGYGNRILSFPEDTLQPDIAFNDKDHIVASTKEPTSNGTGMFSGAATDAGFMAVGRMIVAAINSKGSNLFAATTMNNSTYQT